MHRRTIIPYEGEQPYAFVSYAHKDTKEVLPILQKLYEMGYRIWFDEGIVPGSEWPENIAQHLRKSELVIAFLSPNSKASDNCRREVFYAMEQKKNFLGIYLKDTDLDEGMKMQIGIHQHINKDNYHNEQFFLEEICRCDKLINCKEDNGPGPNMPQPKHPPVLHRRRRNFILPLLTVMLLLVLGAGYKWIHVWSQATCTEASVCRICGEERFSATGHDWQAANCQSPAVCTQCGQTSGTATSHQWTQATCTEPERCSVCGLIAGAALGHQWQEATYSAPRFCSVCGATDGQPLQSPFSNLRVGDVFCFGSYEQDSNTDNGRETIEWVVLEKQEGRILAVSKYVLDWQTYHTANDYHVTWENSSVRRWLNNNFLNEAFSEQEQALLDYASVPADPNPGFVTEAGGDTQDYVFLLSMTEVESFYPDYRDRVCEATDYARARGVHVQPYTNRGCRWWMRTPGEFGDYATSVNSDGSFNHDGSKASGPNIGVRPAVWLLVN